MLILIDKEEKEVDSSGYVYGKDIDGRTCRASWHRTLTSHHSNRENFKVLGGGHVYVINYNAKTYIPESPETFQEYRDNGSKL